MKFTIQHGVEDSYLYKDYLDSNDPHFDKHLWGYCYRTGDFVKDFFYFKIAERIKENPKNYFEIEITVDIHLYICFETVYNGFDGVFDLTLSYHFPPSDPGFYQARFEGISEDIANKLIAIYQKLFKFPIGGCER